MQKVVSKDGTELAYDTYGSGPVLVLVAGGFTERSRYVDDAKALSSAFTVVNYDRRGRGDSGDTLPYAVEREWEDLDAIRSATGAQYACAYSSGSMVLLQAGLPFEKQAMLEPPFRVDGAPQAPDRYIERLQEFVDAGNPGGAAELFMVEAVGQPKEVVDQIRQTPMWAGMEAIAHTLVYDGLQMGDSAVPRELLASVDVPTLAMYSNASPDWLKEAARQAAEALPHGTLEGHDGTFHTLPPETMARVLTGYFLSA
ncbi:alpha/beta fold hydrolase [Kribbella pratensis]|jgi:pimeloyl-ACP methyl ester carboxylesterase|uniref:Pimeloyl-ACP methyl ester carboxylesterase n=1 Tax=Kribbella pratensis TaxID=2512112 RepID=A0A4R8CHL8_9ACTN|nr:alpha/beta hydrolase [Kribbella pratensis]TDW75011.1 pimeloyl-ACP methyl ester carboxylesterase [Kribbella pratensis]